ncbi:4Fe-4S binding protein [Synechococcus lacustris]
MSCGAPNWQLQFDLRRCVVCEQCIAVCPLDAISLSL